jgi:hypothetical protein
MSNQTISYNKLVAASLPMIIGIFLMIVARLTRSADPSSWIKFFDLGDTGLALATIGMLIFAPLFFASSKK